MLLRNLLSVENNRLIDIETSENKIAKVFGAQNEEFHQNEIVLNFENAIVFPGLINSHDHLDFNSFPKLGNKKYSNYVDWGNDIHANNKQEINKVLSIPKHLRIQWGIYKNLLNGITTVINHGPKLSVETEMINVFQQCNNLHSVQLEKNWKLKLNHPFKRNLPVVVHIGEGTDITAKSEINELVNWNIFRKELVGVHAISMDQEQASKFKAIVWCPDSNQFLIGKTAEINHLKTQTKILFGTDSTVSASWNLWEHLKLARQSKMLNDEELYNTLTKNPAETWKLPSNNGLHINNFADIVVAKQKAKTALDAFFSIQPEDILLVVKGGKIRLFDESFLNSLQEHKLDLSEYYKIDFETSIKYIQGNLPALIREIRDYYPEAEFPIN